MSWRETIIHNLRWKLLSLALAALTWLTINSALEKKPTAKESPVSKTVTLTFSQVPVTLLAGPENSSRFRITPTTVKVEVNGADKDVSQLTAREVQAFVDVTDADNERQFKRTIQAHVPREYNGVSVTVIPDKASIERIISPE